MPKEEKRGEQKGFGPVYSPAARALVLGSYPSPKSFEQGFYYGHPQNRFWPLLAVLCKAPMPQTIEEKTKLVVSHGLALWDSLERCTIIGASDSTIQDPVPNNITSLLQKTQIQAVFCNGAASHAIYKKYCQPATGLPAVRLPSTSPANAACNMACLQKAWAPLLAFLNGGG